MYKNVGAPGFGCPGPQTLYASTSQGPRKCSSGKCVSAKEEPAPAPSTGGSLAKLYAQCGGKRWKGATKCVPGAVCKKVNQYYRQCVKKPNTSKLPGLWQQCGGAGFEGQKGKCAYGRPCVYVNKHYSQCRTRE